MSRKFEKNYRIHEEDDVLVKENSIHQDIDLRIDAVEQIAAEFREGNRVDVDAIVERIDADIAQKSALIAELIDEVNDGFTPDRISETPEKRFTSDAEIDDIDSRIGGKLNSATFTAHRDNTNNPHQVTAEQVGAMPRDEVVERIGSLESALKGGVDVSLDDFEKIATAIGKLVSFAADQGLNAGQKLQGRTNIGAQAQDGSLDAIAALTFAANKLLYSTGVDTFDVADLTVFARSLLDDTTAAAARTTLGAQASLGFTPVRQGGGSGQLNDQVNIGWTIANVLSAIVGGNSLGTLWTDHVSQRLISTTGYQRFPSGLTIQWGVSSQSVDTNINFPLAFTSVYGGHANSYYSAGANEAISATMTALTTSGFNLKIRQILNGGTVQTPGLGAYWFAVGYVA